MKWSEEVHFCIAEKRAAKTAWFASEFWKIHFAANGDCTLIRFVALISIYILT